MTRDRRQPRQDRPSTDLRNDAPDTSAGDPREDLPEDPLEDQVDDADERLSENPTEGPTEDADDLPLRRRFVVRRNPKQRLDKYLRQRLKSISRNQIQKLIDLGGVKVNDRIAKASATVQQRDVLDVILPPPPVNYLEPQPIEIDVIYEDEDFIVVNKQADLVVHPARSHLSGTLLNGLANHFRKRQSEAENREPRLERRTLSGDADKTAGDVRRVTRPRSRLSSVGEAQCRPGIVHRLDKNTTGVIVVAKSDTAHWGIARQFEQRAPLKAYLAIVHGEVEQAGGVVDEPIGKHPTIREAYAVRHDSTAKSSVTLYRVRERYRGYTLVELELKTGRTHQIRVHLSHVGHPIVGDIVYGGDPIGQRELDDLPSPPGARRYAPFARTRDEGRKVEARAVARDDLILAHPALHAALLRFAHPTRDQAMTFTAALHEPVVTLLRELRRRPAEGPVADAGYHVDLSEIA